MANCRIGLSAVVFEVLTIAGVRDFAIGIRSSDRHSARLQPPTEDCTRRL
jgi:hypothetical protein